MRPLPFVEAIAWARARQVVLPDTYYGELQGLARAQAFTITGLTSLDQLQQIQDSLVRVLESGETFQSWRQRVLDGPYYLYDAVNDSRTRPTHAAMDGFVARHDDPVWGQWSPACGHRCRCKRIAVTEAQAQRYQAEDARRLADPEHPERAQARADARLQGPDPGWGHDPYQDPNRGLHIALERKRQACQPTLLAAGRGGGQLWCQGPLRGELERLATALEGQQPMPAPRRIDLPLLPAGQGERYYLERFMGAFGDAWNGTALVAAPTGQQLAVSPLLFTDHQTGKTKIDKRERAPYLLYVAETIKRPAEIRLDSASAGVPSLYFLGWYAVDRKDLAILVVFKGKGRVWEGWSGYQTHNMGYVASKRAYPLIYQDRER